MGFTAVWISPVVKNIDVATAYGFAYHGYWAQDIYALNAHFGTPADLKALSAALHARSMSLMVDVVTNHMAYPSAPGEVDYSTFKPFDRRSYYHPYCGIDYSSATSVQQCWAGDTVVSLPDLKTENAAVQQVFNEWIKDLVSNYSIDGLRIDSAQQVNKDFFPSFVSAAGVYAMGEVFDGNPAYLCDYQRVMPGVLDYATYSWIKRAFATSISNFTELADGLKTLTAACSDTTLLGTFIENQDNPRFASLTDDPSSIKNAIEYSILSDGIPIVYYGQEQSCTGTADPFNREALWRSTYDTTTALYKFIAKLNNARKTVIAKDPTYVTTTSTVVYLSANVLVMSKGASASHVLSVFSNAGAGVNATINLGKDITGLIPLETVVDLLSCAALRADSSGNLAVKIPFGLPQAFHRSAALKAGDPCAHAAGLSSSTSSIAPTGISTITFVKSSSPIGASTPPASPTVSITKTSTTPTAPSSTRPLSVISIPGYASTSKSTTSSVSPTPSTTKLPNATKSPTKSTSTSKASCTIASAVAVIFNQNVTPDRGDAIRLVGSIPELANWNVGKGIGLSSAKSASSVWNATVVVSACRYFEYKFVRVGSNGSVVWEKDPNRNLTVPRSCATTLTVNSTWKPDEAAD